MEDLRSIDNLRITVTVEAIPGIVITLEEILETTMTIVRGILTHTEVTALPTEIPATTTLHQISRAEGVEVAALAEEVVMVLAEEITRQIIRIRPRVTYLTEI